MPTYRATGRGYFGQQQVVDLLAYLRLLHNRYDDVALATVLASPFVGVSNDALVLLRRNADPPAALHGARARAARRSSPSGDERLLRAFLQRYERLVRASRRVRPRALCEQILVEHDYDLAVLARWDGRAATRTSASSRGSRASTRRCAAPISTASSASSASRRRFGAKELEAVAEEEGADAVRLLTIHAAKGLEFKVVIVADAGRDTGGPREPDEIVALSDGRFGFRVVHPTRGERAAGVRLRGGARTRRTSRSAPSGCGSTTSR